MITCVPNVLTPEELQVIRRELDAAAFVDGTTTAGWSAKGVKRNLQVSTQSSNQPRLQQLVRQALLRNGTLMSAVIPATMTQPLFNRYDIGMEYGLHVDAALMGEPGDEVRTDVAITLFISDPRAYEGGDLVVNTSGLEYGFKLDAGAAIAYPADSLHRVTPVTQGARHAAIIWVQSKVRDPKKRELLWDLDNAKRQIFSREGKSPTFDAVSKSHANLLRMWAEP